ncbi:Bug family tripartite tricarboxylate transporter substrate binding protein [Roseinatronobacter monicus]|uniref:Tripartite-type tricarboxylate transporter receptor subunit TctC n=1 Tax=Roseinatronobacter monicus TaxID=393481 RepID=A0A543KIL3_9RHOB|nr:tripartite tricarboxylate transporter substrate-binding protein [Roseinatronobacter monicus]TQM94887.1 tripartite-type tricarboxylate transporter receptor subunit TctC [Roseinatronobacter monicus]
MSIKSLTRRGALGLFAVASATFTLGAPAQAQVDFAGQTIEWIIPFGTGGGSDTWARFNAPFLSRHLPGNPTVVVVNEPGGGSTRGTNLFTQRARPDGLTILGTSGSTQFPYLLGDPRVRYEYQDWSVVMIGPTGGVAYVSPSTGVESIDDIAELQGQRLVYASQGATSLDLVPMLAFNLLGFDVNYVFGFGGRGDGRLAFERGEVNIDYQTSSAFINNVTPLVEEGTAVPLMSWGVLDEDGNPQRDPTFPDLPILEEVYEMVHGEAPSGPMYDAYKAFNTAGFAAQKMVVLPEGASDELIETYRQAWRDVFADPEYQESFEAALGSYEQVTDAGADALFRAGTTIDPEVRAMVVDMLTTEYNVRLGD